MNNVQFGTTSPALLLVATVVFTYLLLTLSTTVELSQHSLLNLPKFLEKYSHGFPDTVQKFSIGYFVYFLWLQVEFQAGWSQDGLNKLRCVSGFTAFTPNFPEDEEIASVFTQTPFSRFGMAMLITGICVTILAKYRMIQTSK